MNENINQEVDDSEIITEDTQENNTVSLKKAELTELEKDEKRLANLISDIDETQKNLRLVLISKVVKFVDYFNAKRILNSSLKAEARLSYSVESMTATLKNEKKQLKEVQSQRNDAYARMEDARQFIEAHLTKKIISEQMTLF